MRNRTIVFFIITLFLFNVFSYASKISLPFNESRQVWINAGDTIILSEFPMGWGYKTVVLGISAIDGNKLSGNLFVESCVHNLSDFYKQISFKYNGPAKIRYSGPKQHVTFQWWVGENSLTTSCDAMLPLTREDSIAEKKLAFLDSIELEVEKEYVILDSMNVVYEFIGNETQFKIKNLPSTPFNMIYVQIEPLDGEELNGVAYAGNGNLSLLGWTETLQMQLSSLRNPVFEVLFPRNRRIKIKWWVGVESANLKNISVNIKGIYGDTSEIEYDFSEDSYYSSKKKVSMKYDRRVFTNGLAPVMKKLDMKRLKFE